MLFVVVCIENLNDRLTYGKKYSVIEQNPNGDVYYVRDDWGDIAGWSYDRFKSVVDFRDEVINELLK